MSREGDTRQISSAPDEGDTESAKMGPPPPPKDVEKQEEEKLKAKYPNLKKMGGGSALLNKRLQKGQKYFDSGDYNMAKAKLNNPKKPLAPSEKMLLQESIGDAIPTPEVLPPRKASITTSKLATDSTS